MCSFLTNSMVDLIVVWLLHDLTLRKLQCLVKLSWTISSGVRCKWIPANWQLFWEWTIRDREKTSIATVMDIKLSTNDFSSKIKFDENFIYNKYRRWFRNIHHCLLFLLSVDSFHFVIFSHTQRYIVSIVNYITLFLIISNLMCSYWIL